MTSVTKRIYDDIISKGGHISQEYRDLCQKADKAWDKVRPVLSDDIIEELQNCQGEIEYQAILDWFREGVRVGISLMLELQ